MSYEELDSLLTENEKKVYITLLRLGESTASPILEKTGLQNSVFYRTIHRLMEKGFVTYVLKGKIKNFKAADPLMFINQLKENEEKIKGIIPELKSIEKTSNIKVNAEVFVGVKGLKSMYSTTISDAKKGESYYYFGANKEIFSEIFEKVYVQVRKIRLEKGVQTRGILDSSLRGKLKKEKNSEERYTDFPLPPNMSIFRDNIEIATWGETPTGILIKGKELAEQYRALFEAIWKISKK